MSKFRYISTQLAFLMASMYCVKPTSGATLQQLSLSQMTESATAIVRARVTSSSAGLTGKTIYTHYALQVLETWKGAAPSEVMLPGGVAAGYRQSFPGVPTLQTGSEYVLYLWTSQKTGITHIVGFSQGIFNVTQQSDGTFQVGRARIGETMLNASGQVVLDRAVRMPLTQMKSQVQTTPSTGVSAQ